jgi:hypothetical protein
MVEIYNYRIECDDFYFVDQLVDPKVASAAFKLFVDEALVNDTSIEVIRLKTNKPKS